MSQPADLAPNDLSMNHFYEQIHHINEIIEGEVATYVDFNESEKTLAAAVGSWIIIADISLLVPRLKVSPWTEKYKIKQRSYVGNTSEKQKEKTNNNRRLKWASFRVYVHLV